MIKNKLLKSFSLYSLTSLYQALLLFLITIFLSHIMDSNKFGEYSLYMAIIPFLFNIMYLGITGSVNVFYHKVSITKFKFYLGNIFYILPFSLLLGIILYFLFSDIISLKFHLDKNILFLIVLLVFFQLTPQVLLVFFQTTQNPINYMKYNGVYLSLNFLVTIIAYYYFHSILLIFLFLLFISLLYTIITYNYFSKQKLLYIVFKKDIFLDIITYGTPLILHSLGIAILFMSDRFFISYFKGNEEVAYYSVALQMSMIVLILVNAFSYSWNAYLFKFLKENKEKVTKNLKNKMHKIIGLFLLLPFIFYYVQKMILYLFFDERYYVANRYIFIITLGYSILGIWKVYNPFLFYLKKSKLISFTTLLALLLNLVLNYFLIKIYGSVGVAYATVISMLFLSLINLYFANKFYGIYE